MDLQYQLKAGSYCLYDMRETPSAITGERRCRLRTELVAIAFDLVTGQVHEHGSPTRIHAWALCTRRRLRAAGDWDQADSIVVVSGPLPVDEINKCLGIRGYCRRMFQRLASLPHGKLQPTRIRTLMVPTAPTELTAPMQAGTRAIRASSGGLPEGPRACPARPHSGLRSCSSSSSRGSACLTMVTGSRLLRATSRETEPISTRRSRPGPARR